MSDSAKDEGKRATGEERRELNRLMRCLVCNRGGGAVSLDRGGLCGVCRNQAGTRVMFALRELLKALGMTQAEAAPLLGVSRQSLARVARGERVSRDTAEKLAKHIPEVSANEIRKGME